MIRTMMTEAELVSPAAQREAEDLMTQANPENRLAAEEFCDRRARVRYRRGIGGAIGKKNPVRIERHNLFRGRERRHHLEAEPGRNQPPQNVALDAIVNRDH